MSPFPPPRAFLKRMPPIRQWPWAAQKTFPPSPYFSLSRSRSIPAHSVITNEPEKRASYAPVRTVQFKCVRLRQIRRIDWQRKRIWGGRRRRRERGVGNCPFFRVFQFPQPINLDVPVALSKQGERFMAL